MTDGARKVEARAFGNRFIVAAVAEAVVLMTGLLIYSLVDDNVLWIIGAAALGTLPVLYVLFTAPRSRTPAGTSAAETRGSIVEDARGRR